MSWLGDTVYSIREAATINLKKLTEVFGVEWAKVAIVPKVMGMGQHPNYLFRMTTVQAITVSLTFFGYVTLESLHQFQTISPSLNLEIVRAEIIGLLLLLANDPIPNIRFNVAKSLEALATTFNKTTEGYEFIQQQVVPALQQQKSDPDADVRFFATRALQKAHLHL